ncbi:hypothetical protein GCM10020229_47450 [Kitasatospora albolonga]|uniref:hypothetical protein n=1 Tax=Kitasatospora albolonga TaxID=68173 RepID=UPI0031F15FD1
MTTRKEAVRLAAAHLPRRVPGDRPAPHRRPDARQHPDALAAAIAGRDRADGSVRRSGQLLEQAAGCPAQAQQALVRVGPWSSPRRTAPCTAALNRPVWPQHRTGGRHRRAGEPPALGRRFAPELAGLLPDLVADPDLRTTWRAAVRATVALAWNGQPHPLGAGPAPGSVLHRTVTALLTADREGLGRTGWRAGRSRGPRTLRRTATSRPAAPAGAGHPPLPQPTGPGSGETVTALADLLRQEPPLRVGLLLALVDLRTDRRCSQGAWPIWRRLRGAAGPWPCAARTRSPGSGARR